MPGRGSPWSRLEVEATVASYFRMLELGLKDEPFSKKAHRDALLPLLDGRTPGAVERKRRQKPARMRARSRVRRRSRQSFHKSIWMCATSLNDFQSPPHMHPWSLATLPKSLQKSSLAGQPARSSRSAHPRCRRRCHARRHTHSGRWAGSPQSTPYARVSSGTRWRGPPGSPGPSSSDSASSTRSE